MQFYKMLHAQLSRAAEEEAQWAGLQLLHPNTAPQMLSGSFLDPEPCGGFGIEICLFIYLFIDFRKVIRCMFYIFYNTRVGLGVASHNQTYSYFLSKCVNSHIIMDTYKV